MFLILFLLFLNLSADCLKVESYYIIGDYTSCIKETHLKKDKKCSYIKGLCYLENKDYDKANYIFSNLINEKNSFLSELAFNSLLETYFLKENYSKVIDFTNKIMAKGRTKFSKNSYTKLLNKFLIAKMYLMNKNTKKARKILNEIKNTNTDKFLYSFFIIK